jgi:hypothetical protein
LGGKTISIPKGFRNSSISLAFLGLEEAIKTFLSFMEIKFNLKVFSNLCECQVWWICIKKQRLACEELNKKLALDKAK